MVVIADCSSEIAEPVIEHVYYLQHYAEGWGEKYEEKWDFRPCIEAYTYDLKYVCVCCLHFTLLL